MWEQRAPDQPPQIMGGTLYSKTEKELLAEMKKLVVRYQNPAVYVEEF